MVEALEDIGLVVAVFGLWCVMAWVVDEIPRCWEALVTWPSRRASRRLDAAHAMARQCELRIWQLEEELGFVHYTEPTYVELVNAVNAEKIARGERPGWYDPDDDPKLAPITELGVFGHPDVVGDLLGAGSARR